MLYLPGFYNILKQISDFCVSFCNSNKEILNLLNNIQIQVRQNSLLLKQLLQKQKTADVLMTNSTDSLPLTTEQSLEEYEKGLEDDSKMKLLVCMIMCMTMIMVRKLFL